jgi:hypothetical protein
VAGKHCPRSEHYSLANLSVALEGADSPRGEDLLVLVDGPGLALDAVKEVLRPGKRLDESAPGYGFGLPIACELAELYGEPPIWKPASWADYA